MSELSYCKPSEAGLASEASAVGRRIAKLLNALGDINRWICEGKMEQDCFDFRVKIIEQLRAEGWRVGMRGDNFQVLKPKGYLQ